MSERYTRLQKLHFHGRSVDLVAFTLYRIDIDIAKTIRSLAASPSGSVPFRNSAFQLLHLSLQLQITANVH